MIQIATSEQIEFVKEKLKNGFKKTREEFPGDYWRIFYGLMGQVIIGDILGCKREIDSFDTFDIIWNGKKWDVKTRRSTTDFIEAEFVHNLNERQFYHQCEGYIFINVNTVKGEYYIGGHIIREKFKEHAKFHKPGEEVFRKNKTSFYPEGKYGFYDIEDKYLEKFK